MSEIIKYVQKYSNHIKPFLESLKYQTDFGLDVCLFMVIRLLSNKDFVKFQNNSISQHMTNISIFTGFFLQQFHKMDKNGLFAYLCNKLVQNNPFNIILLKEIIAKMTGCDIIENLGKNQLQSLAGGSQIFVEQCQLMNEMKNAKTSIKSLQRFFWEETNTEDKSLAFDLMCLLGQQRIRVFHERSENITILSKFFDSITNTLLQFIQFLRMSTNNFKELLPKNFLIKLLKDYKLSPQVAFHIARQGTDYLYKLKQEEYDQLLNKVKSIIDNFEYKKMLRTREVWQMNTPKELEEKVYKRIWKDLSPDMYLIFWFLQLDKIYIPEELYKNKIKEIQNEIKKLTDKKQQISSSSRDYKYRNKQQKQIDKQNTQLKKFQEEQTKQKRQMQKTDEFLIKKKDSILKSFKKDGEIPEVMIKNCFYPRLLFSPADAIYCAKFFQKIVVLQKQQYWNIIKNIQKFTALIIPSVHCITQKEAKNLGIFLSELFSMISNWLNKRELLKQASKYCGADNNLSFYKAQLDIYTIRIQTCDILIQSLNSDSFVQVQNTLIILSRLEEFFPTVKQIGKKIYNSVVKIKLRFDKDIYASLLLMSNNYELKVKRKVEKELIDLDIEKLKKEVRQEKWDKQDKQSTKKRYKISQSSNQKSRGDRGDRNERDRGDRGGDRDRGDGRDRGDRQSRDGRDRDRSIRGDERRDRSVRGDRDRLERNSNYKKHTDSESRGREKKYDRKKDHNISKYDSREKKRRQNNDNDRIQKRRNQLKRQIKRNNYQRK